MEKPTYEQLEARLAIIENALDRDNQNDVMPREYAIERGDVRFWYDMYMTMNNHFNKIQRNLADAVEADWYRTSMVDLIKMAKKEHDELEGFLNIP